MVRTGGTLYRLAARGPLLSFLVSFSEASGECGTGRTRTTITSPVGIRLESGTGFYSRDVAPFPTMTHHEYADAEALAELARVVRPDGRLVTVDWSATGDGEDGPPVDERFGPEEVASQLERAGFTVDDAPVERTDIL
ncbi:hypothetical protein [Natronorubrum texcoconense]|uniref:hypothetical protein n=1 Tax=Natronorubrum texcoconense TaxID=1095776 RepID=UPI00373FCDD3